MIVVIIVLKVKKKPRLIKKDEVFKLLVLFDQRSKSQTYLIYKHLKQHILTFKKLKLHPSHQNTIPYGIVHFYIWEVNNRWSRVHPLAARQTVLALWTRCRAEWENTCWVTSNRIRHTPQPRSPSPSASRLLSIRQLPVSDVQSECECKVDG